MKVVTTSINGTTPIDSRTSNRIRAAIISATLLGLLIAAFCSYHKLPWSDEGWFSSPAYNLAQHGTFGSTVIEPATSGLTRIQQRTYWVAPLYLLGQAAWYLVFPPSIFLTRVFTLLWMPVALVAFFAIIRRLVNDRVACVATILLALEYQFLDNTAFARPEIMCLSFGLGGIAMYLILRDRHLTLAMVVANACIAASGLTHPNGILHLAGLAALVLHLDRRRLNVTLLAAAAAPYAIFAALYGIYIAQDVQAFADQMRVNGGQDRWTRTLNPVRILVNEIRDRYFVAYGLTSGSPTIMLKSLGFFAMVGGVLFAALCKPLRRSANVRAVLMLAGLYFAIQCVYNQKLSFYIIHTIPWFLALLAASVVYIWDKRMRLRYAVAAGLLLIVAVNCGGLVMKAVQRSYVGPQRRAMTFLRDHLSDAKLIMGSAALIYEMKFDPRLLDDTYLGIRSGKHADVILVEELYRTQWTAWKRERPADMAQIENRLSEYEVIYDADGYKIYKRASVGSHERTEAVMLKSLSIVIPAYNEEKRLPTSLSTLFEWISGSRLDFVEIILVDDGSTDGTAALVEQMAASTRVVRLLRNGANRGKGYSVKNGILSVRGEWALVTDADLSSPVEEVTKLYDAAVQAKAAIAIGSRALNRALVGKRQPFAREFAGKLFNAVMRSVTGLPFQDTQCGFKLFHSDVIGRIFPLQQLEGFGFDVEDLYIASVLGIRTVEVPVRWNNVEGTKVSLLSGIRSFGDPVRVRLLHAAGKYREKKASTPVASKV